MDLPIKIEAMTNQDLLAVSAIEKESFRDPWSIHSFQIEIETNQLALYLVARLEGKVIGYIGAWNALSQVHITTLAVTKEYRRKGVASKLLRSLVEIAAHQRARRLTLEVRPSNSAALNFYKKLGFEVLQRRRQYYADEDALLMIKNNLTLPEELNKGGRHE